MSTITQKERIYRHLIDFGHINPIEALNEYGIMRLASRISDLRADGVPIKKTMVKHVNRYGEIVHYAKYELK